MRNLLFFPQRQTDVAQDQIKTIHRSACEKALMYKGAISYASKPIPDRQLAKADLLEPKLHPN